MLKMTTPSSDGSLDPLKTNDFKTTGLTVEGLEISKKAKHILERFSVWVYKQQTPCLWVVFLGGTGTGKSTLFNALCKMPISATGVERPKTAGPVACTSRECLLENDFPFPQMAIRRIDPHQGVLPCKGETGTLLVTEATSNPFSKLVLVDTPDLDSIEEKNHLMATELYALSDAVVFVASQEKYADEVLNDFFKKVLKDEKPYFFILNKASAETTREEVLKALQDHGLEMHGARLWLVPHRTPGTWEKLAHEKSFIRLTDAMLQAFSPKQARSLKSTGNTRARKALKTEILGLKHLLEQEEHEVREWIKNLHALTQKSSAKYLESQKERFSKTSGQYLRVEIRKLFARYDLLAKPRLAVRRVLSAPLKLLGLYRKNAPEDRKASLAKVRENVAFVPISQTLEAYNLTVLEKFSPTDEKAPLFIALRNPDRSLTEDEIRKSILAAQETLAGWLDETFEILAKGIPKGKKVGIYSTSILWGILILTFEVVVGGGFTMLDAALDSALAPFVTKGAVEVFAYHEIRKIAGELAKRYREGLLSILKQQEARYVDCIRSVTTSEETRIALEQMREAVS